MRIKLEGKKSKKVNHFVLSSFSLSLCCFTCKIFFSSNTHNSLFLSIYLSFFETEMNQLTNQRRKFRANPIERGNFRTLYPTPPGVPPPSPASDWRSSDGNQSVDQLHSISTSEFDNSKVNESTIHVMATVLLSLKARGGILACCRLFS